MDLANLSVLLVWGAATALAVALIAFAVDLSRLSGAKVDARDAARGREQVTVGAGGAEPGLPYGPDGGTDTGTAAPGAVNRKLAGIGMSVTWLAAALLLVAIVLRGVAAGRAPWANMYEFALVGTFVAVAVFVGVNTRRDVRFLGAFVTGLGVLFLVLAQQQFFVAAMGVQPALQKYWLVIHVGVAICATGIFTVAFVTSVLQLLRDGRDNGSPLLGSRHWGWLDHTPAPSALESLSFRLNSVAFVLWTFTLIGGAIWAEDAWGRYWGWDPKEVWSFIVWVVYAAYLHARTTRGWSGTRAAWFVVAGYACVLFNFTGVNLIFNGKHSYSGL
ncbi:cytochrome c-type biogenesis protein CcsB [Promicromonospora umidemergens]|uniref:C-type cytochrome biogenesis protein CcsB n=1 Tax=Promicromonospora umidemergens TaxID=629679 RepID=A0ABP8X015_9MICO|nr:c-type cytochrome biogenesis protein CcsB [Promicromonospora umidemergens]MCP2286141.1 cytochrome c-type biogenesis protein CcsB [Promicromonospora umidemergens]